MSAQTPPDPDEACPRCGAPLYAERCKVRCPRCGYQEDCSDAGLIDHERAARRRGQRAPGAPKQPAAPATGKIRRSER